MSDAPPAPLRELDCWTVEGEGEERCLLRDPLGLAGEQGALVVPASFVHVARHFDGRRSAQELAAYDAQRAWALAQDESALPQRERLEATLAALSPAETQSASDRHAAPPPE